MLYRGLTGGRAAGPSDINDLIAGYDTPLGRYLGAKVRDGWWYSLPGQATAALSLPDSALETLLSLQAEESGAGSLADDVQSREAMREGMAGQIPPPERESFEAEIGRQLAARGISYLTETDWRASPHYREGMPFEPFMTEARASAKADVFDAGQTRSFLVDQRQNGVIGAVAGFGAMLIGGAPDPVNWLTLGWAGRAALLARGAGKSAAVQFGRAVGAGAAEAGALTAAAEPLLAGSLGYWGDDLTWGDALLDITLGAVTGGAFTAAGRGVSALRGMGRDRAAAKAADAIGEALQLQSGAASLPPAPYRALPAGAVERGAARVNEAVGDLVAHRDIDAPGPVLAEAERGATLDDIIAPERADVAYVAEKVKEPQSLLAFIRDRGGILADGVDGARVLAELKAIGALEARGKPGEGALVPSLAQYLKQPKDKRARPLDYVREAAVEAGYLKEGSTEADLLDAMGRELRGDKVYSAADEADLAAFKEYGDVARREAEIRSEVRSLEKQAATEFPGEVFTPAALREAAARVVDRGEDGISHLADLVERRAMAGEEDAAAVYRELKDEDWGFLDTSPEGAADADIAAYREAVEAGAINEQDRALFEQADAEVERLANIEDAYAAANLCVIRGGG